REAQPGRLGPVAHDGGDPRREVGADQGLHVAAAARDDDDDGLHAAILTAMPRMLGRTSGIALRMLSRWMRSMRKPAAAIAASVRRVRWQLPMRCFHTGSTRR